MHFESQLKYARVATPDSPLVLSGGATLTDARLAYETYGELNEQRDNAIVVFHALTGSAHMAGVDRHGPEGYERRFWNSEVHVGWWDDFVGPRKMIDTRRFFVICANFLGGCYGSTGPASINPATGRPHAASFPYPTFSDMVDAQVRLLEQYGIDHLVAVIGGSVGGCLAMNFALRYPYMVRTVIPIASGMRASVLTKALNFEQIYAIEEDGNFNGGNYYDGPLPTSGLCLARLISHKTFVSLGVIEARAKSTIIQPDDFLSGYKLQNNVESYMLHQGRKFVKRFDANAYLRIINAWQAFDLPRELAGGDAVGMFAAAADQEWLIFSINSDVCFYPDEQAEIASALRAHGITHQHLTVNSEKGHDSFLLEPELYRPYIQYKLFDTHDQIRADYVI